MKAGRGIEDCRGPARLAALEAAGFLLKELDIIRREGAQVLGNAAGDIEALMHQAAEVFARQGFGSTAGLAVYPGYPINSPIAKLRENFVYAHQFPGPEYVLAIFYKVFGISPAVFQWARLFPLLVDLGAVLLLVEVLCRTLFRDWKWARPWLMGALLFVPAQGPWAIQLAGQAYHFGLLFLIVCFAVWVEMGKGKSRPGLALATSALLGFVGMYTWLPMCFVFVAAPIVTRLMLPVDRDEARLAKLLSRPFRLAFAMGLGMVGALLVRFLQVYVYVGNWADAWESQISIAKYRIGGSLGNGPGPDRIMLIGQYSRHVWSFFNLSSIGMLVIGLFVVWMGFRESRETARRLALALVISFLASYAWVLLMKNFSIAHTHLEPRIFILEYLTFVLIGLRAAALRAAARPIT